MSTTEELRQMSPTERATADHLRSLAAAGAPAVTAPPGLAVTVLDRARRARRGRRRRLALGAVALVAAGAVAAGGFTGRGDHREWTQPSGAMEPTVAVGQTVVVAKKAVPQRGDVILIESSNQGERFETLGRVVGLPGDVVSCPAEPDGGCKAVVVSGRALDEPWLTVPTAPFEQVAVPVGEVFYLGDARDAANDSRLIGTQPLSAVLGVVVARIAADGTRQALPGTPPHELPDGGKPVDPADPVPPARTK